MAASRLGVIKLIWDSFSSRNKATPNNFIQLSEEQAHQRVNHLETYRDPNNIRLPQHENRLSYLKCMHLIEQKYGISGVVYAEVFLVNTKPFNSFWAKALRYPLNILKFVFEFIPSYIDKLAYDVADYFDPDYTDSRNNSNLTNFLLLSKWVPYLIFKAVQFSFGWLPRMVFESILSPFRASTETQTFAENNLKKTLNDAAGQDLIGKDAATYIGYGLRALRGLFTLGALGSLFLYGGSIPFIGPYLAKAGTWLLEKVTNLGNAINSMFSSSPTSHPTALGAGSIVAVACLTEGGYQLHQQQRFKQLQADAATAAATATSSSAAADQSQQLSDSTTPLAIQAVTQPKVEEDDVVYTYADAPTPPRMRSRSSS